MTTTSRRYAMPTTGRRPFLLVDTSVAVALVVADHQHHLSTTEALGGRRLGLCGHAAFETFSVLTRLPPPARRTPAVVARVLAQDFPETAFLSGRACKALLARLASGDIGGGLVYDALVGAAAMEHGVELATRDRRAIDTYRALGVDIKVLSSS